MFFKMQISVDFPSRSCNSVLFNKDVPMFQEKIQVTVYFESYCPDSVKFLTTQLFPAYDSPLKEHMNITLVPYGKAEVNQECSHTNQLLDKEGFQISNSY